MGFSLKLLLLHFSSKLILSSCTNNCYVSQMPQPLCQLGLEDIVDPDADLPDDPALPEVINLNSFCSKIFS